MDYKLDEMCTPGLAKGWYRRCTHSCIKCGNFQSNAPFEDIAVYIQSCD